MCIRCEDRSWLGAPQRRDEPRWRGEQRWPAERWHDERRVYDDCRCRGERERDDYDRHNDRSQSHNPRKRGQPEHSSRVGPPIPYERRRDGRQTNDARRPNEHHSSRCADGGGHIEPRKLSALISNAGSADALLALVAAHSTSLNHIHAANLWNNWASSASSGGTRSSLCRGRSTAFRRAMREHWRT